MSMRVFRLIRRCRNGIHRGRKVLKLINGVSLQFIKFIIILRVDVIPKFIRDSKITL